MMTSMIRIRRKKKMMKDDLDDSLLDTNKI